MAFTAFKTWIADAVLPASEFNTYVRDNGIILKTSIDDLGNISWPGSSELTVATAAITVLQGHHSVDTQSDAATDTLSTINLGTGTRTGMFLILVAENLARVVTIDTADNIKLARGESFVMNTANTRICFQHIGNDWWEVWRSPPMHTPTFFAAVNKVDTASLVSGNSWTSWTDLDLGSDVPGGSHAACLIVVATDHQGAMAAVRSTGSGDEQVSVYAANVAEADADGYPNSHFCIIPGSPANANIEYRYGNSNGSQQTVGIEIWVNGLITE